MLDATERMWVDCFRNKLNEIRNHLEAGHIQTSNENFEQDLEYAQLYLQTCTDMFVGGPPPRVHLDHHFAQNEAIYRYWDDPDFFEPGAGGPSPGSRSRCAGP